MKTLKKQQRYQGIILNTLFPNTNGTLLLVASNKYTGDYKCAVISIGNEDYSYYSSNWYNPKNTTSITGVHCR